MGETIYMAGCWRALLLMAVLAGSYPAGAAERVEVPLHQTVLSNGNIRYSVDVSIAGSRPLAAMVDTGSVGLRIGRDLDRQVGRLLALEDSV